MDKPSTSVLHTKEQIIENLRMLCLICYRMGISLTSVKNNLKNNNIESIYLYIKETKSIKLCSQVLNLEPNELIKLESDIIELISIFSLYIIYDSEAIKRENTALKKTLDDYKNNPPQKGFPNPFSDSPDSE
ncbi:MAG: hypothetical protein ACP5OG_02135 [Candidatus Nanoarchaeia archaeon]